MTEPTSIMESLRRRLRELRSERHLTAKQLAERVRSLGGDLGRVAITKIESPNPATQRRVTVEELFLLAAALNVRPMDLVLPTDATKRVALSDTVERTAREMRDWCLGIAPIPWDLGTDWEYYAPDRDHQYHRAKPTREFILWEARKHPAVRAAQDLLDHCEALAAHDVDPFLFDVEPELGLVDIERAIDTVRGHLGPTLERLRRSRDLRSEREEGS